MERKEGRAKVVPTRGQKGLQHHIHRGNDLKPNNLSTTILFKIVHMSVKPLRVLLRSELTLCNL